MLRKGNHGVFFDLDGTLANTAPDLANALNWLLVLEGREPLALDVIRPYVSRGTPALLELAFAIQPTDYHYDALRQKFLQFYADNICESSHLFPGIIELLLRLASRNILWGIVTNKPGKLTTALLDQFQFPDPPAVVVSGDTLTSKKPNPEPLLYACAQTGVRADLSVYVGDDYRDVLAANAAGMKSIAVGYGYHLPEEKPRKWPATHYARKVRHISEWLEQKGYI